MKSWRIGCIAALFAIVLPAPMAMAQCIRPGNQRITLSAIALPAPVAIVNNYEANNSVVGMWQTVFRIGDANGPVFDETFQQFHSDGTEGMISNGLPPALGNVCIGVWKQVGPRAYKLRHMTWNWSPPDGGFGVPGSFAGRFEMVVRLTVDRQGTSFSGTWAAKNFDVSGNHIPELDAEGVVRATRITVD